MIDISFKLEELTHERNIINQAFELKKADVIEKYRCLKNITYVQNLELTLIGEDKEAKTLWKSLQDLNTEIQINRENLKTLKDCLMLELGKNKLLV